MKKNRNNRLKRFRQTKNPAGLLGGVWQGFLGDGIHIVFSPKESADIDALVDFMLNHPEGGAHE